MNTTARTRAFLRIHPLFGAVFLVELLFLAAMAAGALRPLAQVTVPVDSMTRTEAGALVSEAVTLQSGGYQVTVNYAVSGGGEDSAGETVASLDFSSAGNPAALESDSFSLFHPIRLLGFLRLSMLNRYNI